MRRVCLAAAAVSVALAAAALAVTGQAVTRQAGPRQDGAAAAGPRPAAAGKAARPVVVLHPGALHAVFTPSTAPLSTARCKARFRIACYQPAQIQAAYGLLKLYASGFTGSGQTIVVVDSFGSPTLRHDLSVFDQRFGLVAPPALRVIHPDGPVPAYDPHNTGMVGWAGETDLDVEYAHVIAPDANIVVAATPTAENEGTSGFPQIVRAENYVIAHHLGGVISQSFSATENSFPTHRSLLALRSAYTNAARHQVTVLAASGDSGAAGVGPNGSTYYLHPVASWPGTDPLVTAVGGTRLQLTSAGHRSAPDTAWNDTYSKPAQRYINGSAGPAPLATGGGTSSVFARPGYQNAMAKLVGGHRGVPDISMSASCDGAVDMYQSFRGQRAGWYPTCGTSEATPMFAGIVALAGQVAGHPLGPINPALYTMSARHDPGIVAVTRGSNTVSFRQHGQRHTVQGFRSRPGYSLATGVGTIYAPDFVPELAGLAGHTGPADSAAPPAHPALPAHPARPAHTARPVQLEQLAGPPV
ncbi:MAG TPA: S53 family peptidase [Streptosporangiaceae bacterium]|jgi:subtilase family serine protease